MTSHQPLRRLLPFVPSSCAPLADVPGFLLGLSLALLDCSSPPPPPAVPPPPCPLVNPSVTLSASARLNATGNDEGVPMRVRVYQLASDTRLNAAEFDDVWHKDKDVLGPDLLDLQEYVIYPNRSRVVPVIPTPQTRQLAFVALFRESQGRGWVTTYEISPPGVEPCPPARKISLWLDGMRIQDGEGRASDTAATTGATVAPAAPAVQSGQDAK